MTFVKNVTLCTIAWGSDYVKKTIEAFCKFNNFISFEKILFFTDQTNVDLPGNALNIYLPKYFFDKSMSSMKIVGPLHSLAMNPYCHFVLKDLYKYLETSHVLLFQYDGWIKNPKAWDERWLSYDYIGAPWLLPNNSWIVGNGGFSLRSQKLCQILGTDDSFHSGTPEDWLICVTIRAALEKRYGIRFAPVDMAKKFSVEYHFPYDGQFGFHGKWHI
jgi:hypothetical protein